MTIAEVKSLSSEDIIIREAMALGHYNPRRCPKHQDCLDANGADRKIIDFISVDINDVVDDNNRLNHIDVKYNEEYLYPLMQRFLLEKPLTQGVEFPILVEKLQDGRYKIISGHNRKWCMKVLRKAKEIPAFVVESKGTEYQKFIGNIRANGKTGQESRDYNMENVAYQWQVAVNNHNAIRNWKDSGKMREDFENFMDVAHPNQFLYPSTRTKIFNMWKKSINNPKSQFVTWDRNYEDSVLARNSYSSRWYQTTSGKNKMAGWLEHHDTKRKCLIGFVNTKGGAAHDMFFRLQMKYTSGNTEGIKNYGLHLIVQIGNPKSTESGLREQEDTYLDLIEQYNKVFKNSKVNMPLVKAVIFPARLKSQKGKDRVVKL